jgi:hypothetical protein
MPLAKPWRSLDRSVVSRAPDRYGVYELGDDDGTVLEVGTGVLPDELKSAIAYGSATAVRWEATQTREEAEELAEEHRRRLEDR